MTKLATFLGTSKEPDFLQAVYDTCAIEEVKKRKNTPLDIIFHRKGKLENCWVYSDLVLMQCTVCDIFLLLQH